MKIEGILALLIYIICFIYITLCYDLILEIIILKPCRRYGGYPRTTYCELAEWTKATISLWISDSHYYTFSTCS